jgi:hypothetical protein
MATGVVASTRTLSVRAPAQRTASCAAHESVYECQSGTALKELGDMVAAIERLVPDTPGLQGSAGDLELLGRLTLRATLSSQLPVLLKEVCTFESIPA